MSDDTTHPYAEQIRALVAVLDAHPWLATLGTRAEDETKIDLLRFAAHSEVDVHLPGAAVPGIGEHHRDFDADGGRRAFSTFKTQIDGLTVTTYTARRQPDEVTP